MKKEASAKEELRQFLARHCEVKTAVNAASTSKSNTYIFHTKDCVLFMAEAYIQGIRNAIGQDEEAMIAAKKKSDFSDVIMVYNWSAPDPGIDVVQIPESLVEKLTKEQAEVFLRNLQRIQKDIEEGTSRKKALQELFGGKAVIGTSYALDGERQFFITGTKSSGDKRGYAERYAEVAATNVLFDLPKALNAALQVFLPEYARGKHFVEGRSNFHKKMRYGKAEAHTELLLGDEGASMLIAISKESPKTGTEIRKVLAKAILDPFGLSLKYYLGKHPLIKLPSRDDEEK
jgi:hypothetical protein